MMRPVSLVLPPLKPNGLVASLVGTGNNRRVQLTWNDNSITETSFVVQRTANGTTWTDVGTLTSPLNQPNTHGTRTFVDTTSNATRCSTPVGSTTPTPTSCPSGPATATSGAVGVAAEAVPTPAVTTANVAATTEQRARRPRRFTCGLSHIAGAV